MIPFNFTKRYDNWQHNLQSKLWNGAQQNSWNFVCRKINFLHSVNIDYQVQMADNNHQPVIPRKLLTTESKFHVLYMIPVNWEFYVFSEVSIST